LQLPGLIWITLLMKKAQACYVSCQFGRGSKSHKYIWQIARRSGLPAPKLREFCSVPPIITARQ